jgi:multidrug resistance efflux pump
MFRWLHGAAAVGLLALITALGMAQEGDQARRDGLEAAKRGAEIVNLKAELANTRVKADVAEENARKAGTADEKTKWLEQARDLKDQAERLRRRLAELEKKAEKKPALEIKGYLVPAQLIQVSPRVAGEVIEVKVKEGQAVEKGQVLAQIDPRPFEIEVKRAEAALARARAQLEELTNGPRPEEVSRAQAELEEAEAQFKQTEKELARLKALEGRGVSAEEMSRAETQFKTVEAAVKQRKASLELVKRGPRKERVDAAKAAVNEAEATLARARWELDGATVRAPANGTILRLLPAVGDRVDPAALGVASKVCELADLTRMEVELFVPEREIRLLEKDRACVVRAEAFPDDAFKGRVDRLLPIADRAKGAITVRVRLDGLKADGKLRPDMAAIVSIADKE